MFNSRNASSEPEAGAGRFIGFRWSPWRGCCGTVNGDGWGSQVDRRHTLLGTVTQAIDFCSPP